MIYFKDAIHYNTIKHYLVIAVIWPHPLGALIMLETSVKYLDFQITVV